MSSDNTLDSLVAKYFDASKSTLLKTTHQNMRATTKTISFLIMCILLLVVACKLAAKSSDESTYPTPLVDHITSPNGVVVPQSFLGLHINRWSDDPEILGWDKPIPGVLSKVNSVTYFACNNGYTFYYHRAGVKEKLLGVGVGGVDFETTLVALETPTGIYPTIAKLAGTPPKLGAATIKYPTYVPSFGYGAVRSHSSGVNWATLHTAKGEFNGKLMSAWVTRHAGKKLMFTITGTPEWLASSNIKPTSRQIAGNVVTLKHGALDFAIPAGSKIKVRNSTNTAVNGEWVISASTPTSTSFTIKAATDENVKDTTTELLLWGNDGGYGYMNPPKDFSQVNAFVTWLMKNYGNQITWLEGPNEANSGRNPQGQIWYSQGQGLWWAGSFDDLGEMMRRINTTAKAIKPSVLIGAPAITGLHHKQPINQSPSNRANGYQLLSAGDGAGGKLIDWVDFVPFHIYDTGAAWQLSEEKRTLYDTLPYFKQMLASSGVNKPNIPIYMNEGGFEHNAAGYKSQAIKYFDSLPPKQQANEVFKIAAIYAGYGVKGFYPFASGFLGDYETSPEIAAAYDKINKRIAGKTIHPASGFNKQTGAMFFKTTDGYEEYIP